jgi:hypothetical protein
MLRRHAFVLAVALLAVSGCGVDRPSLEPTVIAPEATRVVPSQVPIATASPSWSPAMGLPEGLPIDQTLEPVSRSRPTREAKAVLDMCVPSGDLDAVAGMALLPARDVHRYMLSNGNEPELRGSSLLVWAVQLDGTFLRRRGTVIDPLCVATPNGVWGVFAPYGHVGEPFTPPADFVPPSMALPPLAP